MTQHITIQTLRKDCPDWTWTSTHNGINGRTMRYLGTKGDDRVTVYSVGMVGRFEDEIEVQWRVYTGESTKEYASWWIEQYGWKDDR